MMLIASRNGAPTPEHAEPHLYLFRIGRDSATPFIFEESIGGGHAERGGRVALAIEQLERWPGDWRKHLRLAGAADCIACIEAGIHSGDQAATLQCLLTIGSTS